MLSFSVTFLITVINISILYFLLRKFLWKPLRTFMEERTEKIRRDTTEASSVKRAAEEMRQRYDDLLLNADSEAEWVLRDAEDRAGERSRQIIAAAEKEAADAMRRAAIREALEVAHARDELAEEIARIATTAAGIVAGKSLDGDAERAAADEFVRSVASMESGHGS
jgi:F-type H+-transporting ATPase subunit b